MRGKEGMRRMKLLLCLYSLVLVLIRLSPATSFSVPSHGCYWTESCQSKWSGGCGAGHVIVNQSDDCQGLCPQAKHLPCLPFHTHFHCCKPEQPKIAEKCTKCHNKMDFGDEYVCCLDCSDPFLIDKKNKLGYCKTGAELAVQLKPLEVFKWVTGPWMECSSPCDGGVRYRDVGCFGSMEDASIRHYPLDDSRCLAEEMPARQESCNVNRCRDYSEDNLDAHEKGGLSSWLIALLVFSGLAVMGGLGFAGYTYYARRTSLAPSGFVYVMLEGYS